MNEKYVLSEKLWAAKKNRERNWLTKFARSQLDFRRLLTTFRSEHLRSPFIELIHFSHVNASLTVLISLSSGSFLRLYWFRFSFLRRRVDHSLRNKVQTMDFGRLSVDRNRRGYSSWGILQTKKRIITINVYKSQGKHRAKLFFSAFHRSNTQNLSMFQCFFRTSDTRVSKLQATSAVIRHRISHAIWDICSIRTVSPDR